MAEATVANKTPAAEAAPQKPARRRGKLLWIALAAAVLSGGGGAGAFFFLGHSTPEPAATEPEPPAAPEGLVALDTFLVNLSDETGAHYLKLTLRLTVVPAALAEDIQQKDELLRARIRDRILTLLTSKSHEELLDSLGKENLRHEIRAQLKPLLGEGEVRDVLFADFVIQ